MNRAATQYMPSLVTLALVASVGVFVFTRSYYVLLAPVIFGYLAFVVADWKRAYWLLIFCIPLSVQFNLSRSLALSLPDEPMCWLFSLVFVLLVANDRRVIPEWWLDNPITLVILLQFAWLLVAASFSTVIALSLKFVAAKVWYLICFFVFPAFIFREKRDFKTAFLLFLLPVLASAVVIMYRLWMFEFSFASIGDAVGKLYMNHVEYAAVVSIFYPLLWVAWPLARDRSKWQRSVLAVVILLFLPIIFFTYARVAVLAIIFAAGVGVAIRYRLVNFVMPSVYITIIIALVFLIHGNKYIDMHPDYYHTVMHKDYGGHLSSTFEGKDVSSMERLYRWVAAMRMSVDRPIVGYGPHGFVYNYKPYAITSFKTFVSNNREQSTTHNYFLYMLTEQGWPAMLLYALLVAVVLAQAQYIYHLTEDRFYKFCTLGLAMAFASSFVNNFFSELIETHKAGALFYLIMALLIILKQRSREGIMNA